MTGQAIVERAAKRAWPPVALWIGMIVMIGVGGAAGIQAPGVAYLLGHSLPSAGLGWLVVWFAFLKGRTDLKSWTVFLWLYGATFAGGCAVHFFQVAQVEKAQGSLAAAVERLASGERQIDAKPAASGDMGTIEAFTKKALTIQTNDLRDYEAELAGLGLESFFSEAALSQPDWLPQARFKLRLGMEIVEKYRALSDRRLDALRAEAKQLPVSVAVRQQFLEGFRRGEEGWQGQARERVWQIEAEVLREYGKAVDVLERAQGFWGFEGGQLSFAREQDRLAFNASAASVSALVAEQEALNAKLINGIRANVRAR